MNKDLDKFAFIYEGVNRLRNQTVEIGSAEGKKLYMALQAEIREMKEDEIDIQEISPEVMYWWIITVRDISYDEFMVRYQAPITISLTSYPERIKYVSAVIRSMGDQSKKPDRILLYLAESQFPGKMDDLDEALREEIEQGRCEIRWCEDLKPHKKYFFALQEIGEGVIITVDDDLKYSPERVELLHLSYIRHPNAVSAGRARLMAISEEMKIMPYRYWIPGTDYLLDTPCMQLIATGAGGVLYPAGIFSDGLYDAEGIKQTSLFADDLWLKCHEILDQIPTVVACTREGLSYLDGSQETALWNQNRNKNDSQLRNIINYMKASTGVDVEQKLTERDLFETQSGIDAYSGHAIHYIDYLLGRIDQKNASIQKMKKSIADMREKNQRKTEELTQENEALRNEIEWLKNDNASLRSSHSYRMGNALLKPFYYVKKALKRQ